MKVKAILNSGYFANTRHATNYIAYIDRQSPIFDQNGTEKKVLSAQVEVEAPGNSTVWRHVYSLNANSTEKNSFARTSEKVNHGHDFGGKCCCSFSGRQTTKRASSTGKNSFAQ